jgi:hypothetical protein
VWGLGQQLAEKLDRVIPEAAKRLSGIHNTCRIDAEHWGYGFRASAFGRPRNDRTEFSAATYSSTYALSRASASSHCLDSRLEREQTFAPAAHYARALQHA